MREIRDIYVISSWLIGQSTSKWRRIRTLANSNSIHQFASFEMQIMRTLEGQGGDLHLSIMYSKLFAILHHGM